MVNLTRIYTRTGDDGTTTLGDLSRTRKTDPRLVAYADVDEASCAIGVALATQAAALGADVANLLSRVQNDLYDVGADLCTPLRPDAAQPQLRITPGYVEDLEQACDRYNASLEPLRSFVLPGGTPAAAQLHVARTVVRRAERSVWAALKVHGGASDGSAGDGGNNDGSASNNDGSAGDGGVNPLAARYLNRLSDLLFILCRYANLEVGDVVWTPGGGHAH